jgi:hypothetical protein
MMRIPGLPGKPTLAQIYIKELRTRLDSTLVPLFAPDAAVAVGAIGYFDQGQFVSDGTTLADLGVTVTARNDTTPSDWVFASEGAVELAPKGTVCVGGVDLLKGSLSFRRDRAVVASFRGVTESTAVWTPELNRAVWELFMTGRLEQNSVVVRTVRAAESGTVVVTRKGGISVELTADPKLLGGLLSLQGLGAGVTFTGGTQAAVQLSGPGMTPFARLKGIDESDAAKLADVKRFDKSSAATLADLEGVDVPDLGVGEVEGAADWDEPEDEPPDPRRSGTY